MTRALRRHHRDRVQRKRASYWGGYAAKSPRNRGVITKTPKPCSAHCCGNPRRHFGQPTVQELRAVA